MKAFTKSFPKGRGLRLPIHSSLENKMAKAMSVTGSFTDKDADCSITWNSLFSLDRIVRSFLRIDGITSFLLKVPVKLNGPKEFGPGRLAISRKLQWR